MSKFLGVSRVTIPALPPQHAPGEILITTDDGTGVAFALPLISDSGVFLINNTGIMVVEGEIADD